jgi:hypothetical protein
VVVFKMESDVMLYVVGSAEENEVLLYRYCISDRGDWAALTSIAVWCSR